MYATAFQLCVVLAYFVRRGALPAQALWLALAAGGGAFAGVCLNMAAKTHQLCELSRAAGRDAALRQRERAIQLGGAALCLAMSCASTAVGIARLLPSRV